MACQMQSRTVQQPLLDCTQRLRKENMSQFSHTTHGGTEGKLQRVTTKQPNLRQNKRKCAMSHTAPKIATDLHGPANSESIKRAKYDRPMALEIEGDTEEDEAVAHVVKVGFKQHPTISKGKGKGKQKQRDQGKRKNQQTSSFQPCDDDDPDLDFHMLNDFNLDSKVENMEDWVDDLDIVELPRKDMSKVSEAMVIERLTLRNVAGPSLMLSAGQSSLVDSATTPPLTQGFLGISESHAGSSVPPMPPSMQPVTSPPSMQGESALTQTYSGSSQASGINIPATPVPAPNTFPVFPPQAILDIELVLPPDSGRLSLRMQRPLVRLVITDSFHILCALLLFTNAFPEAPIAHGFVREALFNSALNHGPGAAYMHHRLVRDEEYINRITFLPCIRISIFQHEVKEHCCTIIVPTMMAVDDPAGIVRIIERQLWSYTYTFPVVLNGDPLQGLVQRTQPYRNNWIIRVIRDLFFSGGTTSFTARHNNRFIRHHVDSSISCHVPMVMVSLVATGIYAMIYEWRHGQHQHADFSANSFIDVYQGHVQTLQHILDQREGAYYQLTETIYTLASTPALGTAGTQITPIDVDELK